MTEIHDYVIAHSLHRHNDPCEWDKSCGAGIVLGHVLCHYPGWVQSRDVTWLHHYTMTFLTLEHKTSHKGTFFEIEIYTSSESWINNLSIDVWFVRIGLFLAEIQLWYLYLIQIWNLRVLKNQNIEKIAFKVVQMKFLAMHITNQKLSFDIVMIWNLQNYMIFT